MPTATTSGAPSDAAAGIPPNPLTDLLVYEEEFPDPKVTTTVKQKKRTPSTVPRATRASSQSQATMQGSENGKQGAEGQATTPGKNTDVPPQQNNKSNKNNKSSKKMNK